MLSDKGFDNDALRQELDARGATAVIPPKTNRTRPIACDFAMYRWRHLVENFFCALKQCVHETSRAPLMKKLLPRMNPVRLSTLLSWPTHLVYVPAVKRGRVKALRPHQRRRISSAYVRSPISDLERLRM